MFKKVLEILKEVAKSEVGSPTGNVNLRGTIPLFILIAALLIPSIVISVANFFLDLIFKITMPNLPDKIVVYLVTLLAVYLIISCIVVSWVEAKTRLGK